MHEAVRRATRARQEYAARGRGAAVLHEIRHLSVGREAQEIEALDQDGQRFKLSDYRGKVVLLYFWSEY